MYDAVDVHRETFHDQLEGWLVHSKNVPMQQVDQGGDGTTWEVVDTGELINIREDGETSWVTITQHDGRVFQTKITTEEV